MTLTSPDALHRLDPDSAPLAGRAPELARLRAAWVRAAAGRGGAVLIGGEAGVGKTRLATELAYEAEGAGAEVLVGRCPAGGADPYHALVEALGPVRPAPGSVDRDALFRAMADALRRRARQTPVLVLLDDLHAADRSTVLALRGLAESAAGSAALIVGTYRDVAVDRSHPLAELLDHPSIERIILEGLSLEDLGQMVGDAGLARRLWRWSGGNPVVVGELLRLPALDAAPPASFDAQVARRLDAMDAQCRRVLEAAAAAGTEFSLEAVADAAELSLARTTAAVGRAAAAGFVTAEAVGAATGTRRFVHDLVREAIERAIDPSRRVRLHRRIAKAVEANDASAAPAWLAWQFRAGAPVGGSTGVLRCSSLAGDRAMELLAWEEAAEHYGHALAAARGAPAATRADLLLSLGEAQRLAGEGARARQAFLEAAAVARRAADGPRLARAALALGQVAAVWGADPVLESLAGEARALLGHGAAAPAIVAPYRAIDFSSGELYDALDGVDLTAPAVAHRPKDVDDAAPLLLQARHAALVGPEHATERLAAADVLVASAVEAGDKELVAGARGRRILDLLALGRVEDAAVERSAHATVAGRLGRPEPARDVAAWSAMWALLEGRPADARVSAAQALALGTDAGDHEAPGAFLVQRWALALEWGTADELVAVADECDAAGAAGSEAGGCGPQAWRAMAALALARGGQDDLAGEQLRRAAGRGLGRLTRDPARLHPLTCLAETAWLLGDASVAATVGVQLEPFADRSVVVGRGLAWRGSVARACGLAAALAGRWDDAERHLQAAAAVHRRAGALPLLARTRLEESQVLLGRAHRGDRRKAADAASAAGELARRLGMAGFTRDAA